MSKVGEVSTAVSEILRCCDVLAGIAESLMEICSLKAPQRTITLEQVRAALAEKSLQGHQEAIKALITKHGADKLSQVDPSHYADMLAEVEALQ